MSSSQSPVLVPQRALMLAGGFLAWMFAGLENQLFILIHRQMIGGLLGPSVAESLVAEWFAWFQAAFLLGAATGGWLFGWLGDRFGRTRAMGWSVLCYSIMTFGCYFVTDVRLMWMVRFLACLGFGGAWPNAVALVSEAWPGASKPLMAGIMGSAANFGMVLFAAIAWYFPVTPESWRWSLLIGASPVLVGVLILFVVPESARWLSQRSTDRKAADNNAAAPPTIADVFRPPILKRTLLGITLGAIPVVGTAANANWVVPWTDQFESRRASESGHDTTTAMKSQVDKAGADDAAARETPQKRKPDARQKARTAMLRSTGGIFGSLLGGLLATLTGRRLSYFLISLLTFACSTIVFTQLTPDQPAFPWMTFLLGFFGVTYFGWLPLFLPELFPTRVRATGTGISFNTGRVIAACVVLVAAFRMADFHGDYAQVGFWSGLIYVVGMSVIWLAPTKPPETSEGQP